MHGPCRVLPRLIATSLLALMVACGPMASAASAATINGVTDSIGDWPDNITVLYTWGTPYEMGYAHGALCNAGVWHIMTESLNRFVFGMGMTLEQIDEVWAKAKPYIRTEDLEELRGLADGAGLPLETVQRMHIVPEISEFNCSFFAAWGKATRDGHLIQIRALDYATAAAVQQYPLIHISLPNGHQPYLTVGWQGFVGCVTGMNASKIAMSEIGDDWDQLTHTYDGMPMVFLMKDTVRRSRTLQQALDIVRNTPRTTSYLYCLGDAKIPSARALQTSALACTVYDPVTLPFLGIENCVYASMGMDSNWNDRLGNLLYARYGEIDPQLATEGVMKWLGTGDLHAVCFDVTAQKLWVANAEGDIGNITDGYNRPFVPFDAAAAFAKIRRLSGDP